MIVKAQVMHFLRDTFAFYYIHLFMYVYVIRCKWNHASLIINTNNYSNISILFLYSYLHSYNIISVKFCYFPTVVFLFLSNFYTARLKIPKALASSYPNPNFIEARQSESDEQLVGKAMRRRKTLLHLDENGVETREESG